MIQLRQLTFTGSRCARFGAGRWPRTVYAGLGRVTCSIGLYV